MHRVVVVLVVCCSLLIGPTLSAAPVAAQDEERDLREAGFAAQEILNLAFERKFNAMYDRIHPDAHAVVPRAAAVGAFEAAYAQTDAGQGTVVDGQITSYTWPVTGKEYPYAAEIAFEQPYTDANGDEQVLRDRMFLVKEGEWRWFFGSSPEAVEQAIAAYGGEPTEPLVEGDLIVNVATDLDVFYADVLSYTDVPLRVAGRSSYVRVDQGVQTACGPAETGFWGVLLPAATRRSTSTSSPDPDPGGQGRLRGGLRDRPRVGALHPDQGRVRAGAATGRLERGLEHRAGADGRLHGRRLGPGRRHPRGAGAGRRRGGGHLRRRNPRRSRSTSTSTTRRPTAPAISAARPSSSATTRASAAATSSSSAGRTGRAGRAGRHRRGRPPCLPWFDVRGVSHVERGGPYEAVVRSMCSARIRR